MTAATSTDIDVVQGATFAMQVTWANSAVSPATPIPLSGYRAHMQFRPKPGAVGTPLLELSSEGTAPSLTIEPNGATGVVSIRISAIDTATLNKNCFYDLFVVNKTDPTDATRLVKGAVNLDKSVTINAVS